MEYPLDPKEEFKEQVKRFLIALAHDDFTVEDSFWIGEFEFTVTNHVEAKFENIFYNME